MTEVTPSLSERSMSPRVITTNQRKAAFREKQDSKNIKLVISPNFTIEDIHKVRENNYNITKDMTPQERRDYYNKRGMEVHRLIQERKLQKA